MFQAQCRIDSCAFPSSNSPIEAVTTLTVEAFISINLLFTFVCSSIF